MPARKAKPKISKKQIKATTKKPKQKSNFTIEAQILGGKAGTRKGIKNKRTIETMEKLAKMGCDPVKFNADIMMGKELLDDHSFLPELMKLFNNLIFDIGKMKKISEKIIVKRLNKIKDKAYEGLSRSETPYEYRVQVGKELMKYVAPQLRAIDIKAILDSGAIHLHFDEQDKIA